MIGKPLPAFALRAGGRRTGRASRAPTSPTASRGCSTSSPAGACRARPRRRSSPRSSAQGAEIVGVAIRDRPRGRRRVPRRIRQPVQPHRRATTSARCSSRIGSLGRARDLRDRWPGRDPLPAHRRHPRRARAAAARQAAGGRGDDGRAGLLLACCCCWRRPLAGAGLAAARALCLSPARRPGARGARRRR